MEQARLSEPAVDFSRGICTWGLGGDEEDWMLVLTRKVGETIMIGDQISITITNIRGNSVSLAIQAPEEWAVLRKEIYDYLREQNLEAARSDTSQLQGLSKYFKRD